MPLLAIPTTIALLTDAFKAALEGLTPRVSRGQDVNRWKYYAKSHQPLVGTRWFRFEWTMLPENGDIQTNKVFSQPTELLIVADYGGIPEQDLDAVMIDDHLQLEGVLDGLRRTTDGLRRVTALTPDHTDESTIDQSQVAHRYRVVYLQAKV